MSRPAEMEEDSKIRILLVDDNQTFLDVLTEFLQRQHELVVVGAALSGQEALAQAQGLRPQVVLIDLEMPGLTGLKTIPHLRAILPAAGIIALAMLNDSVYRQTALAAGADDFALKSTLVADLLPAIRRVVHTCRLQEEPAEKI
jgi:DNA-binding NarL/FixJ family response regulator